MIKAPKCPQCGSSHTAAYLYGLPDMDEAVKQQLADGSVLLGGCRCSGIDPLYKCRDCGINFGEPPQTGRYRRELIPATTGVHVHIADSDGVRDISRSKGDTPETWTAFVFALYRNVFLHNWKPVYEGNSTIQWTLTVTLDGVEDMVYNGHGAVPPYWQELLALLEQTE